MGGGFPVEKYELGGRFGYFLFFLLGGGEGGSRRQKGVRGVAFLLKIPGGGGLPGERGRGGAEGPGGCLQGIGGGGVKFFFSGPKFPSSKGKGKEVSSKGKGKEVVRVGELGEDRQRNRQVSAPMRL